MADFIKNTDLQPDLEAKTATANLGYRAKIVVGGSDPVKFVPNINCSFERKIKDEFYLNINASDVLIANEIPIISAVSEIKVNDCTNKYYVNPDGTLEYEIILDKKPATNKISLDIQCSSALEFRHTKQLTELEISQGASQEEDTIGGYAVFCGKRNNQYQTGKVASIKRSSVTDRFDTKTWCEQSVSVTGGSGIWEITLPEKIWSDETLYPLTIGPTIGLTTLGEFNQNLAAADRAFAQQFGSLGVDATLNSINGWFRFVNVDTREIKLCLWTGASSPFDLLVTGVAIFDSDWGNPPTTPATDTTGADTELGSAVNLVPGFVGEDGNCTIWFDDGSFDHLRDTGNSFATPDNFDGSATWTDRELSLWLDYDLAGATSVVTGTIIDDSPTEDDIRTGGKTIIITVTDDTWVATVGQDNEITDALILGITSAQSEGTGWNVEVRGNMTFDEITRTSPTVVTIILAAEAAYDITATETIEVTIPAAALTAAEEVVATPTFEITHVAAGAIINQLQQSNLGSDLFNGTLL